MTKNKLFLGYVMIVASAVIYGCMPLMANYIYDDGVTPMSLVLLRNMLSLPLLSGVGLLAKQSFRSTPKNLGISMLMGVFGCAITPILLFSSYSFIGGGTATVLHFIYPATVLLIEFFVLRSRVKAGSFVAIGICVLGIVMFYNPAEGIDFVGSMLALSSGVTYAIYIVLLGKFGTRGFGVYVFSFYAALGSTALMLIACIASGEFTLPTSALGWLLSIVFAVAVNGAAVVLFQCGTVIVGGQKASVLSTFEPLTGIAVGYFAFAESVSWRTLVGSALVIAAVVLIAVFDRDSGGRAEEKDPLQDGSL